MEGIQVETNGVAENENVMGACYLANPASPPTHAEHSGITTYDPIAAPSAKHRQELASTQDLLDKTTQPSVSNCYVFKSRLQEYCQKAGLTTPVYETIKEGPSHKPFFRSAVVVNNVRYDSLPGFFNRKAAEQSAAEVALLELSKSADTKFGISTPVHETGLCKNLLQEYSQKMNYAIPLYECHKEEKQGRMPMYSCVVEIGGIKYIGASASSKKEAEIKAARTALLAIQSSSSSTFANHTSDDSVYTVVPQKKAASDLGISTRETAAALKPKKARFKNHQRKKRRAVKRDNPPGPTTGNTGANDSDAAADDDNTAADVVPDTAKPIGIAAAASDGCGDSREEGDGV